jgi:hypothetical protein
MTRSTPTQCLRVPDRMRARPANSNGPRWKATSPYVGKATHRSAIVEVWLPQRQMTSPALRDTYLVTVFPKIERIGCDDHAEALS